MKKIVFVTLIAVLAISTPAAAKASDPAARTDAGQFYLSAICPVNAAFDDRDEAWKAAGLPKRVLFGTPLPQSLLVTYKRIAKVSGRAAVALNKYAKWPESVSPRDIDTMIDAYYKDSTRAFSIFQAGTFKRSQGKWADTGNASQNIRKALNLPPRPQGCPK